MIIMLLLIASCVFVLAVILILTAILNAFFLFLYEKIILQKEMTGTLLDSFAILICFLLALGLVTLGIFYAGFLDWLDHYFFH